MLDVSIGPGAIGFSTEEVATGGRERERGSGEALAKYILRIDSQQMHEIFALEALDSGVGCSNIGRDFVSQQFAAEHGERGEGEGESGERKATLIPSLASLLPFPASHCPSGRGTRGTSSLGADRRGSETLRGLSSSPSVGSCTFRFFPRNERASLSFFLFSLLSSYVASAVLVGACDALTDTRVWNKQIDEPNAICRVGRTLAP